MKHLDLINFISQVKDKTNIDNIFHGNLRNMRRERLDDDDIDKHNDGQYY